MLFTSEEAKDMRCPLRVDGIYCLGNKCAAWRWYDVAVEYALGYCGMAGRPEAITLINSDAPLVKMTRK